MSTHRFDPYQAPVREPSPVPDHGQWLDFEAILFDNR